MSSHRKLLRKGRTAAMILVAGATAAACGAGQAVDHSLHHSTTPAPSSQHGGKGTPTPKPTPKPAPKPTPKPAPKPTPKPQPKPAPAPAPVVTHGQQAAVSAIPWSEVGQGWTLALWSASPTSPETLFLVDPVGGRYVVTTGLPTGEGITAWFDGGRSALLTTHAGPDLNTTTVTDLDLTTGSVVRQFDEAGYGNVYLSGDGERILFEEGYYDAKHMDDANAVTVYDLATGATLDHFDTADNVQFTNPDGLALLEATPGYLMRMSLSGSTEQGFPTQFAGHAAYNGEWIESADGATLVMGNANGLAIVSNDGSVTAQLPSPVAHGFCSPLSWASEGVVLARCGYSAPGSYTSKNSIWLMPIGGGTPSYVGSDTQFVMSAVEAGGTWYGQAAACGTAWIVRIGANGEQTIDVPGTVAGTSQNIVGSDGDNLEVMVTLSCGSSQAQRKTGSGTSLMWFDPATNGETVLLGPGVNGGMVDGSAPWTASTED